MFVPLYDLTASVAFEIYDGFMQRSGSSERGREVNDDGTEQNTSHVSAGGVLYGVIVHAG